MAAGLRAACLVIAGVVALAGCNRDAPPGSAPRVSAPAGRHGESGLAALARSDYPEAERQAVAALRERPDDAYAMLALARTYEQTGRPDLARQYYQTIRALDPPGSAMIGSDRPQPLAAVAQAGLDRLAGPAVGEPLAERPAASPANAARRFAVLRDLVERGLVTPDEFAVRRTANLGALLPYSERPPALGLDWPPPGAEAVAGRLRALAAGLEGRSLTAAEHAAERRTILDALLPAQPPLRRQAPAGPLDPAALAAHLARLQELRGAGLIGAEEQARERAAAERLVATAETRAAPRPLTAAPPAKPAAAVAKAGGVAVHLGSLRSEPAARRGWSDLRQRFPELLGRLDPAFSRVEVAGKGTFWRITAGPLEAAAAQRLCDALKQRRQYCQPLAKRG